jgi:hypothetical protein
MSQSQSVNKQNFLSDRVGVRLMPEFILTFLVRECRDLVVKCRTTEWGEKVKDAYQIVYLFRKLSSCTLIHVLGGLWSYVYSCSDSAIFDRDDFSLFYDPNHLFDISISLCDLCSLQSISYILHSSMFNMSIVYMQWSTKNDSMSANARRLWPSVLISDRSSTLGFPMGMTVHWYRFSLFNDPNLRLDIYIWMTRLRSFYDTPLLQCNVEYALRSTKNDSVFATCHPLSDVY